MLMIFVHGNKNILAMCIAIVMAISYLCICKISEKKIELKLNMKEHNIVISELEESNRKVVEGGGL